MKQSTDIWVMMVFVYIEAESYIMELGKVIRNTTRLHSKSVRDNIESYQNELRLLYEKFE